MFLCDVLTECSIVTAILYSLSTPMTAPLFLCSSQTICINKLNNRELHRKDLTYECDVSATSEKRPAGGSVNVSDFFLPSQDFLDMK